MMAEDAPTFAALRLRAAAALDGAWPRCLPRLQGRPRDMVLDVLAGFALSQLSRAGSRP